MLNVDFITHFLSCKITFYLSFLSYADHGLIKSLSGHLWTNRYKNHRLIFSNDLVTELCLLGAFLCLFDVFDEQQKIP